jgi:tRNA nucleotidyltransferase (CCA-adding enzyme)
MFQVLLDVGAAATLLPADLVSLLAQEHDREELRKHFELSPPDLESRSAVALMKVAASEIRSWSECVRMPIEVRDFSEIFSELHVLICKSPHGVYDSHNALSWFNRADVWRKPERGQALLGLAGKLGFPLSQLTKAMQSAQALQPAQIIAALPLPNRSDGESIREAVERARLAAITAALL